MQSRLNGAYVKELASRLLFEALLHTCGRIRFSPRSISLSDETSSTPCTPTLLHVNKTHAIHTLATLTATRMKPHTEVDGNVHVNSCALKHTPRHTYHARACTNVSQSRHTSLLSVQGVASDNHLINIQCGVTIQRL